MIIRSKYFQHAVIHVSCYHAATFLTLISFASSDARGVYAFFNAWWFSLYVDRILDIEVKSLMWIFILACSTVVVAFLTGITGIHDIGRHALSQGEVVYVMTSLFAQSLIVCSPILVNAAVMKFLNR